MSSQFSYTKENTLLKIENVSLELGEGKDKNLILKDVNIEIKNIVRPGMEQGQVIGFLGPSGIGKTKLFEVLSGLLMPTTGIVKIHNPSIENNFENSTHDDFLIPVRPGAVGVVQQDYPLFEFLTIYDNLLIAAKKGGIPKSERKEKVDTILNDFDLYKHKDKWPKKLSGGQRQRIAIAQQLLCSKDFLLLDEPFSGLDMIMIEKVQNMFRKISCSNELITIIIVSHDVVSTSAVADTLWVMGRDRDEKGQIIPGAKIKYCYDLIERDIAWKTGMETSTQFLDLIKDIKNVFPTL